MAPAGTAYIRIVGDWKAFDARFASETARLGKRTQALGATMGRNITVPLVGAGVAAVGLSTKFKTAMTKIETQAGAPRHEIRKLKNDVLDLAKVMPQGPLEMANALYHL